MKDPKESESGIDPAAQSEAPESQSNDTSEQLTADTDKAPVERGGPKGLEPTRYGDWESKGRCIDF